MGLSDSEVLDVREGVEMPDENYGTYKTVKARSWPWLSSQ
jgi:hypothetical protein